MENEKESSKVIEFFRNSNVFLTGGTGFIGKILTCKLLETCDVSCIYLLVRKKSSESGAERIRKLLDHPVFLRVKNTVPDYLDRIKYVKGDCSLENLGLSTQDEQCLCKNVNFVIHCAAAMNMLGSFKTAVEINVQGTRELINLAKKMICLKAFVHLSTLNAVIDCDVIDEKIYETHLDYEDCLNLLKVDRVLSIDNHDREKIIGSKVTIYGFTKAVAENIFIREKISAPVIVFRFALAFPCWKEPIAGWTDDFYGPSGMFALSLFNIIPTIYFDKKYDDFTPADLIVNALIAVTQYSYDVFQRKKEDCAEVSPFVYNYFHRDHKNSKCVEDISLFCEQELNHVPNICSNKIFFILWNIMFGYIPVIVIDFVTTLFGYELRLFQKYRSFVFLILKANDANFRYEVKNDNVQNCWKNLNCVDKKLFSFDLNEVNWDEYSSLACYSVREYLDSFVKKNKRMRLAIFWIPKIRFALKTLYCIVSLYCIHLVYKMFECFLSIHTKSQS